MKRIIYILSMVLTILSACTEKMVEDTRFTAVPLSLGGNFALTDSSLYTEGDTVPLFFLRADDAPTANWATIDSEESPNEGFGSGIADAYLLLNKQTGGGNIVFRSPQYFDFNVENKAHLIGYTPQHNAFQAGSDWQSTSVSWQLDGKKDVFVSEPLSFDVNNISSNLVTFKHRLCWLQLYVTAYDSTAKSVWGDVVDITLIEVFDKLTYTPPYNYQFSGMSDIRTYKRDFSYPDTSGIDGQLMASFDSSRFFSQVYVPVTPYDASNQRHFRVRIKTTNYEEYKNITVNNEKTSMKEGTLYRIRLIFRRGNVVIESSIQPWNEETVEGVIK